MAGTSSVTRNNRETFSPARAPQTRQVLGTVMSKRPKTRDEVGHYTCPNCGSGSLVRDAETGEVICTNCGFVLSDPAEQYAAPVPRRTEEGLLESQSGPQEDSPLSTRISPRSFPERRRRTGR